MANQGNNKEELINEIKSNIDQKLTQQSKTLLNKLIIEAYDKIGEAQLSAGKEEWKNLWKKLNNDKKIEALKDQNHRKLIIGLIKFGQAKMYNYSYFNRSKVHEEYVKYLYELGPYLFIEVIMVVNKLKVIHKYFYQEIKSQTTQKNQIDMIMIEVLNTCNQAKRSVNSNLKKFLMIVEDADTRLLVTKQLGKMLRQSWKRDKENIEKNKHGKIKEKSITDSMEGILWPDFPKDNSEQSDLI